ncbi:hypothetical protein [Fimbriiglobus ruber]|uniref:Uncharacterized protein n=1 Tax=Fimbriiglobus ruber TaxID=1908690 RepID=A0A225D5K5_9BACT|nr:hypothetical protein [Fimbriiglobus ruber]OWK36762.1 hypothetical protein FRUB_09325 [Fimbriiglobus ruber]
MFLFAGPHNWLEARYVLGRLPARAGKLWGFFLTSAVGILGLTAGFAALPLVARVLPDGRSVAALYAGWNTLFVVWVAVLVWMRSRTNPRFDGGWVWPAALMVVAGVWLSPIALNYILVYAHPLLALWFLDRELARYRRNWLAVYRCALLCIPALLGFLWWLLADAPNLPGDDPLTLTIARHAGGGFLSAVSTHFLVAAHTFLEAVHYGVWVLLIPLIGLRSAPWDLTTIPAARRGARWKAGVGIVLACGLMTVAVLWAAFTVDFGTTRTVYFTIAMLHVLAEIPFLLRTL